MYEHFSKYKQDKSLTISNTFTLENHIQISKSFCLLYKLKLPTLQLLLLASYEEIHVQFR